MKFPEFISWKPIISSLLSSVADKTTGSSLESDVNSANKYAIFDFILEAYRYIAALRAASQPTFQESATLLRLNHLIVHPLISCQDFLFVLALLVTEHPIDR